MVLSEEQRSVLTLIKESWQINPERIAATHGLDVTKYELLFLELEAQGLIGIERKKGEIVAASLTEKGEGALGTK